MMLPLKHPRIWLTIGWCLVMVALIGFLMPARDIAVLKLNLLNDKVTHAGAYAVLFLWFAGLYPRSRYAVIAASLLFMGVIVEFLQDWLGVGRSRDIADIAANAGGIGVGLILALTVLGGWAQRVEGRARAS